MLDRLLTYESALKARRHQLLRLHQASYSTISLTSSLLTSPNSFSVLLQSNRPSILSQRGSSRNGFIASLCNVSMKNDRVPKALKEAYITPMPKKSTLDSNDINNYKPISNLSVLSKLLEKSVCKQLVCYVDANNLMPRNQSTYRRNHSIVSAFTKVFSDIMSAIDKGNLVLLSLLYLSAAFDCVDHKILLNRLDHSFGIQSKVLKWLTSYLTGRTHCVHLSGQISFVETRRYGVQYG